MHRFRSYVWDFFATVEGVRQLLKIVSRPILSEAETERDLIHTGIEIMESYPPPLPLAAAAACAGTRSSIRIAFGAGLFLTGYKLKTSSQWLKCCGCRGVTSKASFFRGWYDVNIIIILGIRQ